MSTWYCGVPAFGNSEKPTAGTKATEPTTSIRASTSVVRGAANARCNNGAYVR